MSSGIRTRRPVIVVGHPEHRRVTMFQQALVAQGHPPANVVAWQDVVARRVRWDALAVDAIFRIDSMGEHPAVERALIERGEPAARQEGSPAISARELAAIPDQLGRILFPRQAHLGWLAVLADIERELRPGWRMVQPIEAITLMFDKRATSRAWRAAGIPCCDAIDDVRDPEQLRAEMRARQWPEVFVKVASASSASCLAIFHHARGREYAVTTVEDTGDARYNTRKLQRLTTPRAIDRLLHFLLAEGAQVERAHAKARDGDRHFDLRVLAIDGEAPFVVMRTSPHPITNLHLGGARGDAVALRARVPAATWDAAMESAVRVQTTSTAFHVGVDLLLTPELDAHRVIEGNAFGDLLPNLTCDGLDVYGWQVRRLLGDDRQA